MRNLLLNKKAAGLLATPVAECPRDTRTQLDIVCTLRISDERLPARICDLSSRGFGARSVRPMPIGSRVTVSLPMVGEVRAEVRWALGGMFGGRFLDRVEVRELLTVPTEPVPPSA